MKAEGQYDMLDCHLYEDSTDAYGNWQDRLAAQLIMGFAIKAMLETGIYILSGGHMNPLLDVLQVSHDCKRHHHQQ